MIESQIIQRTALNSNADTVAFPIDSVKTRACWLCYHQQGFPIYEINSPGIYEIEFQATATSATAGIVAFGVYQDGVLLPGTVAAETLAAAGDLANLSTRKIIRINCNCDASLTIQSVPSVDAGATATPTETQIPIITSANVIIKKIA